MTATLARPTARLTPDTRHPTPRATNGHSNGTGPANGNGHTNGNAPDISAALLARAGVLLKDPGPVTARSEQFADFQTDAPPCDNCGAITVRNGNCYLCHNCGSSMGCS
jgi:ribonucleoside-diphosphate reductase alpha chain